MATLDSATKIRCILAVIGTLSYQPLTMDSELMLDPPLRGPRVPRDTKTDLTRWSVGCTTRSAPP